MSTEKCRWCGMIHGVYCPVVKAIEYFADGTVKKVEFKDNPVAAALWSPPEFVYDGSFMKSSPR